MKSDLALPRHLHIGSKMLLVSFAEIYVVAIPQIAQSVFLVSEVEINKGVRIGCLEID